MRSKKFLVALVVLVAFAALTASAETHKLRRIGVNTFAQIRGQIPTAEVMKQIAEKYAGDLKYGLDLANMGDLYLPVMEALRAGKFTEKDIAVGDKFPWMLFRVAGKVKLWEDVEWAGAAPLPVFSFPVIANNNEYEFVIPKPCGNLALYKTTPVVVVPPPSCSIVVSPAKVNVNEPVNIDMSGTTNAATMSIEILNAAGAKIATQELTSASPKWQTKFDKPGEYTFTAKAANADKVFSGNLCQAKVVVNAAPTCKLWTSCLPCDDYVGKPITFDASGSTDPDGQLVKAVFEVTDEAGQVIDTFTKTEKPFVWEKTFNTAGKYGINVVVFDDMGAASSNTDPCRISLGVTQKKLFFLLEAGGLLARGTYTGYFFGRLGLMYVLSPNTLDLILRAGAALPTQGEPWKTFFMADALLNIHLGPTMYLDAGLGYTTKELDTRTSGLDLVGDFGINIFGGATSTGSIFVEGRLPVLTSNRSVTDHYKLGLGFRYIF